MIALLLILVVNGINGLPEGAPKSACSTLMPRHGEFTTQTSKKPYEIHAELSGNKAVVHVSSPVGEKFEGFVLQARSSHDRSRFIDGEFTNNQLSKTINCFDSNQNTLTHVNRNSKTEIMTEWIPKENVSEEVIFRATIAKKFDIFWTEIDSNPVKLNNSASLAEEKQLYETCFKTEGCVGLPDGCIEREDCKVLLRYSKASDGINFNLQGRLESSKYMAMALSEDALMGEDSVTECIREGDSVIARESWNEGKSNTRTRELSGELYTGSFVDGMTSCSWKSPLVTIANAQTYDFTNKSFYILLATGNIDEWRLKFHSDYAPSTEALNLTKYRVSGEVSDPDMKDSSPKSTDFQHPQTTHEHEIDHTTSKGSSDDKDEIVPTSPSSCLSMCSVLFIIGLFFATKENVNVFIF